LDPRSARFEGSHRTSMAALTSLRDVPILVWFTLRNRLVASAEFAPKY
jgi:hypothetical protein